MQDFRSLNPTRPINENLELVLIEVGVTRLAVRAASIKRLQRMNLLELESPGPEAHPALRGFVYSNSLPVFDLAQLLGFESATLNYKKDEQILIIERGERRAGFVVEQAQEVIRAALSELDTLPLLVQESLLRPAAWALWRKSKEEIIILVEPTECFSDTEWSHVINKG